MVSATASLSENKKEWKTEIEKVHKMDDLSDTEKAEMLENKKDDEMAVVKATMLLVLMVVKWVPAWVE